MAIRYDKKLNQEINRTIKNFNQKIARLERQDRELLPSKITKKDLKNSVYTRTELRRKLKQLQRPNFLTLIFCEEVRSFSFGELSERISNGRKNYRWRTGY